MKLSLIVLIIVVYVAIGIVKLRYFDRNKEGNWLIMLMDERNRRCGEVWVWIMLLVIWLTWPIAIFSKEFNLTGHFVRFQWRYTWRHK